MEISEAWRAYLRWSLRLLTVGVAAVMGGTLIRLSPLIVSLGGEDEVVEGSQSPHEVARIPNTAEHFTGGATVNKIPHYLRNSLYFSSYDGTRVYENRGSTSGTVARKPFALEKRMFDQVQEEAIHYLKGRGRGTFSRQDCSDIRYRLLPTAGLEVELICSKSSSPEAERVVLLLPFHSSRVLLHTHVAAPQVLGIIVPLQGRVETLQRFLSNLREVVRDSGLHLVLSLVYFDDQHTQEVVAALEAARSIEGLQTQYTILKGKFSRSRGLNVGVEQVTSDVEVVFLCDVDVVIKRDFLLRCLASPDQGRQVFFPVFFSQHNPTLTNSVRGWKVSRNAMVKLADHHGFWRLWSFGMVCLYKTDFLRINGFDSLLTGWGGEDVRFSQRVSKMGYSITRSLDHGLLHQYHPKDCSHAGKNQRASCLRTQATCEASGQTFGLWYFKHKYDKSMWSVPEDEKIQEEEIEAENEIEEDEETTNEEQEKREERDLLSELDNVYTLKVILLVMVFLNIILLYRWVASNRGSRCRCST